MSLPKRSPSALDMETVVDPCSLHRELRLLAGNLQEAMVDALGVCIITPQLSLSR